MCRRRHAFTRIHKWTGEHIVASVGESDKIRITTENNLTLAYVEQLYVTFIESQQRLVKLVMPSPTNCTQQCENILYEVERTDFAASATRITPAKLYHHPMSQLRKTYWTISPILLLPPTAVWTTNIILLQLLYALRVIRSYGGIFWTATNVSRTNGLIINSQWRPHASDTNTARQTFKQVSVQTNFLRLETASWCDIVRACSANIYGPSPLSNALTNTHSAGCLAFHHPVSLGQSAQAGLPGTPRDVVQTRSWYRLGA